MYAALGRGDAPPLLSHLAADVLWDANVTIPNLPQLQPRRARTWVAEFAAALGAMAFERFQPAAIHTPQPFNSVMSGKACGEFGMVTWRHCLRHYELITLLPIRFL